jgi:hypothetical protein
MKQMKHATDEAWMDKQRAAQELGVSTKTLEKLVKDGKLRQRKHARAGRPPIALIHAQDVAAEREARANAPTLHPSGTTTAVTRKPTSFSDGIMELMQARSLVPAEYMTVREAVERTPFNEPFLRQQIREGRLPVLAGAGKNGADVIRRADLNKL